MKLVLRNGDSFIEIGTDDFCVSLFMAKSILDEVKNSGKPCKVITQFDHLKDINYVETFKGFIMFRMHLKDIDLIFLVSGDFKEKKTYNFSNYVPVLERLLYVIEANGKGIVENPPMINNISVNIHVDRNKFILKHNNNGFMLDELEISNIL